MNLTLVIYSEYPTHIWDGDKTLCGKTKQPNKTIIEIRGQQGMEDLLAIKSPLCHKCKALAKAYLS